MSKHMDKLVKDLSGMRFGMLNVLNEYKQVRGKTNKTHILWKCRCDCGREVWVRGTSLRYGTTKSCNHHRNANYKHGLTNNRIYYVFYDMHQRCENPNNHAYKYYGERGICVCDEWSGENGVVSFANWAFANGYKDGLSIDRIDVNGNYEPSNCRWADVKTQARNKRNNRYLIDSNGTKKVAADIATEKGIDHRSIYQRIKSGWENDDVINPLTHGERTVNYNGADMNLHELAEATGLSYNTLQTRYTRGFSDKDMVAPTWSRSKPKIVQQYDKNGKLIAEYESGFEASKQTGTSISGIRMCCLGQRKTCHGFVWKYKESSKDDRVQRSLNTKPTGGWIDNRGKIIEKGSTNLEEIE